MAITKKTRTKVVVEVTQRDIDKGEKYDANSCPVARALHRAGLRRWYAVYDGVCNNSEDTQAPDAGAFALDFDTGLPCKPFRFVVKLR